MFHIGADPASEYGFGNFAESQGLTHVRSYKTTELTQFLRISMKKDKKSLAALVGAGIVTSLSTGAVTAAENPFTVKELASGYAQVAEAEQAKKPEAKCGAEVMKSNPEMKCGATMMQGMGAPAQDAAKAVEKKCAGMKMDGAKPAVPAAPAEAPKK